MTGNVYLIPIQGHTQNRPHPQVVVLELDRECLLVPAFDADGKEVTDFTEALARLLGPQADIFVELDNAKHVRFRSGFTGKRAKWVVARAWKMPKREVARQRQIGTMDAEGLARIIKGLLSYARQQPALFSPHLVKRLRKLAQKMDEDG